MTDDRLWPWVISRDALQPSIEYAYKQVTMNIFILEPRLGMLHDNFAAAYRPVYLWPRVVVSPRVGEDDEKISYPSFSEENNNRVGGDGQPYSYWLDMDLVPPSERPRWAQLLPEHNLKEAESLMEFIELFSWNYEKQRFIIRNANRGWLA